MINTKTVMTQISDGGTAVAPVPKQLQNAPALSESQALRLVDLALMVEDLCKTPVDIEWCRTGDQLFVLQARPITGAIHPDPWNDSRSGDFLWTNTNVGEAIPDVMTPATWSMVQVFLTDAMATASIPPYVGYGRIGGRIYLNLSVMMTFSAAVGVNQRSYRSLSEEVFGKLPDDLEIPPVKAHWRDIIRAVLPMALHVLGEARRDARVLDAYLLAHPALCDRRRAQIAAISTPVELADLWTEVLSPEFHRVSWMLSAATRSSGASFITTRKRLQRLIGDAGANALTAGLAGEAGQLASLGLLDGLEQLAAGELDRDTFNRRYGHRGPHEFEISLPRPGEDPTWIDTQLAARATSATSYRDMLGEAEMAERGISRPVKTKYASLVAPWKREPSSGGTTSTSCSRPRLERRPATRVLRWIEPFGSVCALTCGWCFSASWIRVMSVLEPWRSGLRRRGLGSLGSIRGIDRWRQGPPEVISLQDSGGNAHSVAPCLHPPAQGGVRK